MNKKLFISAITKFILGVLCVGILIFFPAGTLSYFGGWLLLGVLFVPMFIAGVIMFFISPDLLERRLLAKESQKEQSRIIKISALMFISGFIVASLDFRFAWSELSKTVSIVAAIVFLLGYLLYLEVIRENKYLSRVIKTEENQKVVESGLYSFVRHPMYGATLLIFLSMPIILGSLYAFVIFLVYPFIIANRIKYEEELLEKELIGYKEYKQKVRYCLIPLIW